MINIKLRKRAREFFEGEYQPFFFLKIIYKTGFCLKRKNREEGAELEKFKLIFFAKVLFQKYVD